MSVSLFNQPSIVHNIITQAMVRLSPEIVHLSRVNKLFLQTCIEIQPLLAYAELSKKFHQFSQGANLESTPCWLLEFFKYQIGKRLYSTSTPVETCKRFLLRNFNSDIKNNFNNYCNFFQSSCGLPCGIFIEDSCKSSFQFCGSLQKKNSFSFPLSPTITKSSESPISLKLLNLFKQQKYTDCIIKCKDTSFNANKNVLASASDVFDTMLSVKMKENQSTEIYFSEKAKLVKIFIAYLYNPTDVFQEHPDVDPGELLQIAHRYEIKDLVERCIKHIGDNGAGEDWETIGRLGLTYNNQFLLEVATHHRFCQGEPLPNDMKDEFKKRGLPHYSPTQNSVCVKCDVGFENTLGICFGTTFEDKTSINLSTTVLNSEKELWHIFYPFTWTHEGWVGLIPAGKEFKFAKKLLNQNEVVLEKLDGNRLLKDDECEYLILRDVNFG
jgi:hypothetical protein